MNDINDFQNYIEVEVLEHLRTERLIQSEYHKLWHRERVKSLYSFLIRNRRIQLWRRKLGQKDLLNVGCAGNIFAHCINIDYRWQPHLDLCWDITRCLPLPDHSIKGIITEHCLEHIPFKEVHEKVFPDFRRLLQPGSTLRIIVPDAEMVLDFYQQAKRNGQIASPVNLEELQDTLPLDATPMMRVNRVFRNYGHLYAYDFQTLEVMLRLAGFIDIRKERYMQGRLETLLLDSKRRADESLYVEATAP